MASIPPNLMEVMKELSKYIVKDSPDNVYQYAFEFFNRKIIERDGHLHKNYEIFQEQQLTKNGNICKYILNKNLIPGKIKNKTSKDEKSLTISTNSTQKQKNYVIENEADSVKITKFQNKIDSKSNLLNETIIEEDLNAEEDEGVATLLSNERKDSVEISMVKENESQVNLNNLIIGPAVVASTAGIITVGVSNLNPDQKKIPIENIEIASSLANENDYFLKAEDEIKETDDSVKAENILEDAEMQKSQHTDITEINVNEEIICNVNLAENEEHFDNSTLQKNGIHTNKVNDLNSTSNGLQTSIDHDDDSNEHINVQGKSNSDAEFNATKSSIIAVLDKEKNTIFSNTNLMESDMKNTKENEEPVLPISNLENIVIDKQSVISESTENDLDAANGKKITTLTDVVDKNENLKENIATISTEFENLNLEHITSEKNLLDISEDSSREKDEIDTGNLNHISEIKPKSLHERELNILYDVKTTEKLNIPEANFEPLMESNSKQKPNNKNEEPSSIGELKRLNNEDELQNCPQHNDHIQTEYSELNMAENIGKITVENDSYITGDQVNKDQLKELKYLQDDQENMQKNQSENIPVNTELKIDIIDEPSSSILETNKNTGIANENVDKFSQDGLEMNTDSKNLKTNTKHLQTIRDYDAQLINKNKHVKVEKNPTENKLNLTLKDDSLNINTLSLDQTSNEEKVEENVQNNEFNVQNNKFNEKGNLADVHVLSVSETLNITPNKDDENNLNSSENKIKDKLNVALVENSGNKNVNLSNINQNDLKTSLELINDEKTIFEKEIPALNADGLSEDANINQNNIAESNNISINRAENIIQENKNKYIVIPKNETFNKIREGDAEHLGNENEHKENFSKSANTVSSSNFPNTLRKKRSINLSQESIDDEIVEHNKTYLSVDNQENDENTNVDDQKKINKNSDAILEIVPDSNSNNPIVKTNSEILPDSNIIPNDYVRHSSNNVSDNTNIHLAQEDLKLKKKDDSDSNKKDENPCYSNNPDTENDLKELDYDKHESIKMTSKLPKKLEDLDKDVFNRYQEDLLREKREIKTSELLPEINNKFEQDSSNKFSKTIEESIEDNALNTDSRNAENIVIESDKDLSITSNDTNVIEVGSLEKLLKKQLSATNIEPFAKDSELNTDLENVRQMVDKTVEDLSIIKIDTNITEADSLKKLLEKQLSENTKKLAENYHALNTDLQEAPQLINEKDKDLLSINNDTNITEFNSFQKLSETIEDSIKNNEPLSAVLENVEEIDNSPDKYLSLRNNDTEVNSLEKLLTNQLTETFEKPLEKDDSYNVDESQNIEQMIDETEKDLSIINNHTNINSMEEKNLLKNKLSETIEKPIVKYDALGTNLTNVEQVVDETDKSLSATENDTNITEVNSLEKLLKRQFSETFNKEIEQDVKLNSDLANIEKVANITDKDLDDKNNDKYIADGISLEKRVNNQFNETIQKTIEKDNTLETSPKNIEQMVNEIDEGLLITENDKNITEVNSLEKLLKKQFSETFNKEIEQDVKLNSDLANIEKMANVTDNDLHDKNNDKNIADGISLEKRVNNQFNETIQKTIEKDNTLETSPKNIEQMINEMDEGLLITENTKNITEVNLLEKLNETLDKPNEKDNILNNVLENDKVIIDDQYNNSLNANNDTNITQVNSLKKLSKPLEKSVEKDVKLNADLVNVEQVLNGTDKSLSSSNKDTNNTEVVSLKKMLKNQLSGSIIHSIEKDDVLNTVLENGTQIVDDLNKSLSNTNNDIIIAEANSFKKVRETFEKDDTLNADQELDEQIIDSLDKNIPSTHNNTNIDEPIILEKHFNSQLSESIQDPKQKDDALNAVLDDVPQKFNDSDKNLSITSNDIGIAELSSLEKLSTTLKTSGEEDTILNADLANIEQVLNGTDKSLPSSNKDTNNSEVVSLKKILKTQLSGSIIDSIEKDDVLNTVLENGTQIVDDSEKILSNTNNDIIIEEANSLRKVRETFEKDDTLNADLEIDGRIIDSLDKNIPSTHNNTNIDDPIILEKHFNSQLSDSIQDPKQKDEALNAVLDDVPQKFNDSDKNLSITSNDISIAQVNSSEKLSTALEKDIKLNADSDNVDHVLDATDKSLSTANKGTNITEIISLEKLLKNQLSGSIGDSIENDDVVISILGDDSDKILSNTNNDLNIKEANSLKKLNETFQDDTLNAEVEIVEQIFDSLDKNVSNTLNNTVDLNAVLDDIPPKVNDSDKNVLITTNDINITEINSSEELSKVEEFTEKDIGLNAGSANVKQEVDGTDKILLSTNKDTHLTERTFEEPINQDKALIIDLQNVKQPVNATDTDLSVKNNDKNITEVNSLQELLKDQLNTTFEELHAKDNALNSNLKNVVDNDLSITNNDTNVTHLNSAEEVPKERLSEAIEEPFKKDNVLNADFQKVEQIIDTNMTEADSLEKLLKKQLSYTIEKSIEKVDLDNVVQRVDETDTNLLNGNNNSLQGTDNEKNDSLNADLKNSVHTDINITQAKSLDKLVRNQLNETIEEFPEEGQNNNKVDSGSVVLKKTEIVNEHNKLINTVEEPLVNSLVKNSSFSSSTTSPITVVKKGEINSIISTKDEINIEESFSDSLKNTDINDDGSSINNYDSLTGDITNDEENSDVIQIGKLELDKANLVDGDNILLEKQVETGKTIINIEEQFNGLDASNLKVTEASNKQNQEPKEINLGTIQNQDDKEENIAIYQNPLEDKKPLNTTVETEELNKLNNDAFIKDEDKINVTKNKFEVINDSDNNVEKVNDSEEKIESINENLKKDLIIHDLKLDDQIKSFETAKINLTDLDVSIKKDEEEANQNSSSQIDQNKSNLNSLIENKENGYDKKEDNLNKTNVDDNICSSSKNILKSPTINQAIIESHNDSEEGVSYEAINDDLVPFSKISTDNNLFVEPQLNENEKNKELKKQETVENNIEQKLDKKNDIAITNEKDKILENDEMQMPENSGYASGNADIENQDLTEKHKSHDTENEKMVLENAGNSKDSTETDSTENKNLHKNVAVEKVIIKEMFWQDTFPEKNSISDVTKTVGDELKREEGGSLTNNSQEGDHEESIKEILLKEKLRFKSPSDPVEVMDKLIHNDSIDIEDPSKYKPDSLEALYYNLKANNYSIKSKSLNDENLQNVESNFNLINSLNSGVEDEDTKYNDLSSKHESSASFDLDTNMRYGNEIRSAIETVNDSSSLESTVTESTIINAVTKIQAVGRGYLTRLKLKRGDFGKSLPAKHYYKSHSCYSADSLNLERRVSKYANVRKSNSWPEVKYSSDMKYLKKLELKSVEKSSDYDEADRLDDEKNAQSSALASRRLTLQRTDAVQINSTDNTTEAELKKKDKEIEKKWLMMRQSTMPVQIDAEILRLMPKHLRKRIRSADTEKKKKERKFIF